MELQKFGIEIRKAGTVSGLYKDVDRVLGNYGLKSGDVNCDVQKQTTAHALQKMLGTKSYLCVSTIDQCADLCQIVISAERRKVYRAVHCVYWSEMLPEYRTMVVAMILDDFRSILNP